LFKDADKSINIGQKHEWAYTTTLDYTTNEVCNVRKTGVNFSLLVLVRVSFSLRVIMARKEVRHRIYNTNE